MSKGKVKIEIASTYYFSPEQWAAHNRSREEQKLNWSEYLESICLPQQRQEQVDMSDVQVEEEGKKDVLLG